ncbi:MAG: hypothetical protein LBC40_09580 [Dysgonamonadaceae bacterium]|nr:hypothetical protein [Dysgonamonadaceae bacterium]
MAKQANPVPAGATSYLRNKLTQIAALNGLAVGDGYTQFAIIPKIDILSITILPGPPKTIALNLDITLYIADSWGEKIFATTTMNVNGVGVTENGAYMEGIKQINTKNPEFKKFVTRAKNEIINYYNNTYQTTITKARSLAGQKKYSEALFYLNGIPECSSGYEAAIKEIAKTYQLYIDDLCEQNLSKASMAWLQDQSATGAGKAGEYLQYIYPGAKCYNEAMALYNQIDAKVKEDWNFAMKVYDNTVDMEKQRIDASKEVGLSFGNNQQPATIVEWID